jgi:hypothetical protein
MKSFLVCLFLSSALAFGAGTSYNLHGIGLAIQLGIMSLVFGIESSAILIAHAITEAKK